MIAHNEPKQEYIFSDTFAWVHYEQSTPIDAIENCEEIFKYKRTGFDSDQHGNVPYYVRTYLKRPESDSYPKLAHASSQETDSVITVINEILKANEIEISTFLRISINAVHPCKAGAAACVQAWPRQQAAEYTAQRCHR